MEWMYDHFYKVLWKLLVRANRIPRAGGGASRSFKDGEPVRGAGYVLAFAGCSQGDGASTIAYNFACAFASYSSRSVLLVDGNVRQPVLHLQFPDEKQVGLTDLAEGQSSVEDAVLEITPGRYYFLRSGARSVNPVMLFESEDFFSVMEQLRARYDVVIFDCPPLLDNPEAILLANATDGLIMILQAEKTRWEAALAAVKDLESARIPVLGAILNKKQITPEPLSRLL
jgi:capsular exopolysaccharide synthesis family protein